MILFAKNIPILLRCKLYLRKHNLWKNIQGIEKNEEILSILDFRLICSPILDELFFNIGDVKNIFIFLFFTENFVTNAIKFPITSQKRKNNTFDHTVPCSATNLLKIY